jgi:hypothetical protein
MQKIQKHIYSEREGDFLLLGGFFFFLGREEGVAFLVFVLNKSLFEEVTFEQMQMRGKRYFCPVCFLPTPDQNCHQPLFICLFCNTADGT